MMHTYQPLTIKRFPTPKSDIPFIGHKEPFVSPYVPHKIPIVGRNIPSVCVQPNLGFTLVELIITLAIFAIIASFAVPNLRELVLNNRIRSDTNEIVAALSLARSEAVKQKALVTVCASDTGTACTAALTNWHKGWVVWSDRNGDGDATGDPGEILRVSTGSASNITLTGVDSLQYRGNGTATVSGNIFSVCDSTRSNEIGRTVVISATGRASVKKKTDCPL